MKHKYRWSKRDKQDFADNRLRSKKIPPKRDEGPTIDEYEDDDETPPPTSGSHQG